MWFPDCVFTKLAVKGAFLRAGDLIKYALIRLGDEDATRYIESAQCLALLFYLGNPPPDTVIVVRSGRL